MWLSLLMERRGRRRELGWSRGLMRNQVGVQQNQAKFKKSKTVVRRPVFALLNFKNDRLQNTL